MNENAGAASSRDSRHSLFATVLFLLNVLILSLAAWFHTIWRDEALAWIIARSSPSLQSMWTPMHYDGHPPLWYLMLFGVTRFTTNPMAMKLLTLATAIAVAALLLLVSRLSLWKRAGFAFSYFFVFEYGTIERNYLLGIACLLCAVLLLVGERSDRRFHAIWFLCVAALLSSQTMALSLAVVLLWIFRDRLNDISLRSLTFRTWKAADFGALFCFLICVLISYCVVHPPADSNLFLDSPDRGTSKLARLVHCGSHIARAFFPVPPLHARFWDKTLWETSFLGSHHLSTLLGWLIFISLVAYLRAPAARLLFLTSSILIAGLIVASGRAYERHVGFFFVAFVLSVILEDSVFRKRYMQSWQGWRDYFLGAVLVVQVYAALFAVSVSLFHPFSSAPQVAKYLQAHNLLNAPIVIEPDPVGTNLLAYTPRQEVYSVEMNHDISYPLWNLQEMHHHLPTLTDMHRAPGTGQPVLITDVLLNAEQQRRLQVHLLASFDQSMCSYDSYFLYR